GGWQRSHQRCKHGRCTGAHGQVLAESDLELLLHTELLGLTLLIYAVDNRCNSLMLTVMNPVMLPPRQARNIKIFSGFARINKAEWPKRPARAWPCGAFYRCNVLIRAPYPTAS